MSLAGKYESLLKEKAAEEIEFLFLPSYIDTVIGCLDCHCKEDATVKAQLSQVYNEQSRKSSAKRLNITACLQKAGMIFKKESVVLWHCWSSAFDFVENFPM